jgi:hypothetical protein
MKFLTVTLLVASALVCPTVSSAQWQLDGVPLAVVPDNQGAPVSASDGAGGAIVAYHDNRNSGTYDVYAQRVNNLGAAQWASNGVALCAAVNDQISPVIVSDGAGGAIAVWWDSRSGNYDLYAQKINASGVVQWTANGVAIVSAAGPQYYSAIVSDGAGGAIISWQDQRSGDFDIYAQRVNAAGVVQWTANGVPVGSATGDQSAPALVADGAGGVIIVWQDARSGNYDIYAERVNASGSLLWIFPTVVCGATGNQLGPAITSDGAAGAIVTWQDQRSGNYDIQAQRVNGSGVTQWISNGVVLGGSPNDQTLPMIASDGSGGAIVTWQDFRNGSNTDVYAQRVGALGNSIWTFNGLAMCTAVANQSNPAIAADGSGGAIVTWEDNRAGNFDVYAQRVNAAGAVQWATDGMAACTASNTQNSTRVNSDGSGGGIVTWADGRAGQGDIYAQRVEGRYGYWGRPEPILDVVKDNKNDQGGKVVLNWRPSGRDALNQQTIYAYSIWRALDVAPLRRCSHRVARHSSTRLRARRRTRKAARCGSNAPRRRRITGSSSDRSPQTTARRTATWPRPGKTRSRRIRERQTSASSRRATASSSTGRRTC